MSSVNNTTVIVIFDNTYYGQNQDYQPSRRHIQEEYVYSLLQNILENPTNMIGILPLCQPSPNYILTPSKNRKQISKFMSELELREHPDFNTASKLCLSIASKEMFSIEGNINNFRITLFLGSPIKNVNEVVDFIKDAERYSIPTQIFLFGEAIEIYEKIGKVKSSTGIEKDWDHVTVKKIDSAGQFMDSYFQDDDLVDVQSDDDPALKAALELSKKEY